MKKYHLFSGNSEFRMYAAERHTAGRRRRQRSQSPHEEDRPFDLFSQNDSTGFRLWEAEFTQSEMLRFTDRESLSMDLQEEYFRVLNLSIDIAANAEQLLQFINAGVIRVSISPRTLVRGIPRIQYELEQLRDITPGTNVLDLGGRMGNLVIPQLNILSTLVELGRQSQRRNTPLGIYSIARPNDSDSFHSHLQAVDLSRYGGHTFNEWAQFAPEEINLGLVSLIEDLPVGSYALGLPRLPIRYGNLYQRAEDANRRTAIRRGDYEHMAEENEDLQMSRETFTPGPRLSQMPEPAISEPRGEASQRSLNVYDRLSMIESREYRLRLTQAIETARARGVHIMIFRDKFVHVHVTVMEFGQRNW
ncbi:hypothetical protein [Runella sp.]|uniref:hypothetical protein n=1 Tax=Runella sp. TaxID=1960881 RepID=UPI003D0A4774